MGDLTVVEEAARELLAMIEEADGRDMVSKRTPKASMSEEPSPEEAEPEEALASEGGDSEEPPGEDTGEAPMTPEERRKLLGF